MKVIDFQTKQIDETILHIETYRSVLVQLPTGGGKTVEFSFIIKKFLHNHIEIDKGPVLILVHREELLYQTYRAVKEVLGFEPQLITSSTNQFLICRCYIGMVESTMSRLHMINHPSLVIIDECHIQNFNKVHMQFPEAKILGFSATPISASKKEPLNKYYKSIVTGPSIKELIGLGFLSQNITRAPDTGVDPSEFQIDKLKGEYNERQMSQVYSMSKNVVNCVRTYHKYCLRKKTLIFNVTIEHSKEVNEVFNDCGYPSKHLDSNSKDRKEIFKWFKETPDAILNSVMIPTMGFDEPTVQSVILNYSTLSLTKFIQTCGRGSRIVDEYFIEKFHSEYPYELKLKNHFDIIDLGHNWKKFGDWNDERDWKRIFKYPDMPGDGIAPVKTCPKCEGLVHAAVRVCPLMTAEGELCNHEFQRRVFKEQDIEEMILITKGIDINALSERAEKKYKYYPFFELAIDVVNNMFFLHGNNPPQSIVDRHFKMYYELCVEWYDKTLAHNVDEIGDITNSGWHIKKARNNFNSLIIRRNKDANKIDDSIPYSLINPELKRKSDQNWDNYKQATNLVNGNQSL